MRLDYLNYRWQGEFLAYRNDRRGDCWYPASMAASFHDWYLKDWLVALGKRQADLVRDLDWNKAKASLMVRGGQQYNRDAINELAAYLNLRPYELLMHPDDAMALRSMQTTALKMVDRQPPPANEEDKYGFDKASNH